MGKGLQYVPTEYIDIKKIYKVAYDWKVKVVKALDESKDKSEGQNWFDSNLIQYEEIVSLLEETKSDRFEVELPEIELLENLIKFAQ
jgi:hypothetical protein